MQPTKFTIKQQDVKTDAMASQGVNKCLILGYSYFIIEKFPSSKYEVIEVIACVVMCVLTIPVILLNGITVLTIFKRRQLREKVCLFPVLLQSMADLSVGLLTLPLFSYLYLSEVYGSLDCVVSFVCSTLAFMSWGLSLAAVCALTFERYMGVLHPVAHRNYVTKKMFLIYAGCVLVVTLIIVPLAVVSAIFFYIFSAIYAFVPVVFHTFCYSRIFFSTRKRLRQENCTSSNDHLKIGEESTTRVQKRYCLKEIKLAKSCALIVFIFYVFCIPGEVINNYYLQKDKMIFRVVISWCATALGAHTIFNSLIFFWTRPMLRKEAFKVLKGIFGAN